MNSMLLLLLSAIGASGETGSVELYKSYFGPVECVQPEICFNPDLLNLDDLRQGLEYQARDDDVFIVSYPKTGTFWTKQIVTQLFNNGTVEDDGKFQLWTLCPFLDFEIRQVRRMKRPNAIHSHLPMSYIPWNPKAKYIIVTRNPKDTVVSYFFYLINFHYMAAHFKGKLTMRVAIDAAYNHSVSLEWGNYFDWYKKAVPFLDLPNVYLVVYEEMKVNPVAGIRDIAKFLQVSLSDELLEAVLKKSDMKYMKQLFDNTLAFKDREESFVRKGVVGDWRNHLTNEESRMIDAKMRQAFVGTKFEHLWDKFDVFEH
ncbi:Amine sulfotransferase [Halotydeus destructor]|nr:Amine sulfotransferase [Halotydeus destructor]